MGKTADASAKRVRQAIVRAGVPLLFLLRAAVAPVAAGDGPFLVPAARDVFFQDDLGLIALQQSVDRSIAYLDTFEEERQFSLCGRIYSAARLRDGLELFAQGLAAADSPRQAQRFLLENFTVCRARGSDGAGTMLVTGYFEPLLAGSLQKKAPYLHPLYRPPADLLTRRQADGGMAVGRMAGGEFLPYWTRGEIEDGRLSPGDEILYLADPLDVFILHVQGSGRVRLPDGTIRPVRYAASNGRPYRSIGRVLVERGVMDRDAVTMPRIIEYLHAHPAERDAVLRANERYIFFSLGDEDRAASGEGPPGSMGQPLTAGRSVALDPTCFPAPLVGFLETELPRFDGQGAPRGWRKVHRFVVNQDSGAAIRGPGRVDLFLGGDGEAEQAAGVMKQPGALYFFLLKEKGDSSRIPD